MMFWIPLAIVVITCNFQSLDACGCIGFWAGEEYPLNTSNYYSQPNYSVFTEDLWPVLAAENATIFVIARDKSDFGDCPSGQCHPDLLNLIKKANEMNVCIKLWLVVPFEDCYYACEKNCEIVATALFALNDWTKRNNLTVLATVLDEELCYQDYVELADILFNTNLDPVALKAKLKATTFFSDRIDPKGQCESARKCKAMFDNATRMGINLATAMTPFSVADIVDKNLALQDGLNISTAPLINGSYATYPMLYRGSAVGTVGLDPGPKWVSDNFVYCRKKFGNRCQLSLGIVGDSPYDNRETLMADIRMASGLNATEIVLYSLETCMAKFNLSDLVDILNACKNPIYNVPFNAIDIASATATDAFLQVFDVVATEQTLSKLDIPPTIPPNNIPNAYPYDCGV